MIGTADLILFGIQAAVRLAQAGRDIYREDTLGRSIEFPLPQALAKPVDLAVKHAQQVQQEEPERFKREFEKAYLDARKPGEEDIKRKGEYKLIELYALDLAAGKMTTFEGNHEEIGGSLAINQWAKGDAAVPHPLQRTAGVLVEIAVDYFVHVPGALNENSRYGRTMKAFLTGLDAFNFQESRWDHILVTLFTTAVDTVAQDPGLLSEDEGEETFIKEVVAGVSREIKEQIGKIDARSPEGDPDAEERVVRFGQLVLRSLIKNSGTLALQSPSVVSVRLPGDRALINAVGSAVLNLLVEDTDEGGLYSISKAFERMASRESVEKLIVGALKAAGEHPEVFRIKEKAYEEWIKHVLTGLYQGHKGGVSFFHSSLFPEIAYLVVDHGLRDLPALLQVDQNRRAMLVTVARHVFEAVSDPPHGGGPVTWRFDLSESDVRALFVSVLGAFSSNPHWLFDQREKQKASVPLIGLAMDMLTNLGHVTFKTLIQSGRLESVFSALLASGLLEGMDENMARRTGAVFQMILEGVSGKGQSGLGKVLEDSRLRDLLTALAASGKPALEKLFGSDAQVAAKAAEGLVEILDLIRSGRFLSVEDMSKLLKDKEG
jgi:hypothetical protein